MKTEIKTWLPIFPGFYNTIFEAEEEDNDYNDISFDYEKRENNIAKDCCNYMKNRLKNLVLLNNIIFENIHSPKFYNYENDSININVELTDSNILNLKKYLKDNINEFYKYLNVCYSPAPGFMPYYSNIVEEWLNDLDNVLKHEHKLGSILEFICSNEKITGDDLYNYCCETESIYLSEIL